MDGSVGSFLSLLRHFRLDRQLAWKEANHRVHQKTRGGWNGPINDCRKLFRTLLWCLQEQEKEKNLAATKALLARLVLLDLTDESSHEAGRILALLEEEGDLIGFRDALIAAIAKTHKMPLATRDTEHFSRVPDLQVLGAP